MARPDLAAAALLACAVGAAAPARGAAAAECVPTPADALGPFYRPGAPVRSSVGTGHVLHGTVRSAAGCAPIPGARVELWLAGPNGYDDAHRATLIADDAGRYRFESEPPHRYDGRPPHIHVRVAQPGYRPLVTQYYPAPRETDGTLDLVLVPAR